MTIFDTNVPTMKKQVRNKAKNPWISSEMLDLIQQRNYWYKQYCKSVESKSPNLDFKSNYKTLRNTIVQQIRKSKKEFFVNLINEHRYDPKKLWNTLNKVLPQKSRSKTVTFLFSLQMSSSRLNL